MFNTMLVGNVFLSGVQSFQMNGGAISTLLSPTLPQLIVAGIASTIVRNSSDAFAYSVNGYMNGADVVFSSLGTYVADPIVANVFNAAISGTPDTAPDTWIDPSGVVYPRSCRRGGGAVGVRPVWTIDIHHPG